MRRIDPLRIAIAVGSLVIGYVHLRLYLDGYKDIPIENVGRSFLLNIVAAGAVAVVVLVWPHRLAVVAPLLLANGTLLAFALSRTDRGIFGFTERGWNPSPEAAVAVVAELTTALLAVVALARSSIGGERDALVPTTR